MSSSSSSSNSNGNPTTAAAATTANATANTFSGRNFKVTAAAIRGAEQQARNKKRILQVGDGHNSATSTATKGSPFSSSPSTASSRSYNAIALKRDPVVWYAQ